MKAEDQNLKKTLWVGKKKKILILFLIILIAFVLRFYRLAEYPTGFHIDEASLGYNAYSLLKTAHDENGKFLPLHIDMFGDFRPAGYQYLDILPVALFGLNEFAVRFPSSLFGALTPLVIFLLSLAIFRNYWPAILSAILLTFSFWHLVVSRASAETVVALFFIILGAYFFVKSLYREKKDLIWATISWLISLFFYHTPRVFLPMLGGVLLVIGYHSLKKKNKVWSLIWLGVIISTSLLLVFSISGGTGRFQQVSIFHFPEIRLVLEEQIREDGILGLSSYLTRFFHNKVINYSLGYLREYFRYFSLNYLFIDGGFPSWYQIPNVGLMNLMGLPFLIVGLYLLIKNSVKNRLLLVPVCWLFLGPMVAAVTRDDTPNIQRSLVMLPALIMIVAYGLSESWRFVKKKTSPICRNLLLLLVIFAFSWNFAYFLHQYFVHGRLHRPWYRFNGFKEMVLAVNELAPNYDEIIVTKDQGGIYMHFLFFQKFDPKRYQELGSPKDKDWHGFGKLIFAPQICPTKPPRGLAIEKEKTLYVASANCNDSPFIAGDVNLIRREDNTVVFRIYPAGKSEMELELEEF